MSRKRLVVLPDLTASETERLGGLIASPTYRAMMKEESAFYRAYWLATALHRPAADAVEFLLPAIWEAKNLDVITTRRSRTARYQRALIDATRRFGGAMSLDDRAFFWFQAANALREMGRFAEAERMRQSAVTVLPRLSRPLLKTMILDLGPVIARHDATDEPLDMIPPVQARIKCELTPPTNTFDKGFCAAHR